ncbi:MAG: hypothetical protein HRT45_00780 [Bdellovibrionales bacterium]|nr:hypothetical protein [Bdellovibrionales bacterium]
MTNWLTLSDYSKKYDVSVSTLRRRIKGEKAEYQFEDGKYLLIDRPLNEHNPNTQKVSNHHQPGSAPFAPPQESQGVAEVSGSTVEQTSKVEVAQLEKPQEEGGQFWVTVNAMMNELKKAYSLILQEKEEQILQLKDEHSDLRTLVRVLEEENKRLKNMIGNPKSLDTWLERYEQTESKKW